jgi:hypothetical protein
MIISTRSPNRVVSVSLVAGGTGYTAPPNVAIVGGGGTGAAAVAHMAGTAVESVVITASGTGYTGSPEVQFSGGGGTGAAATAFAYTGPIRPMAFLKGRFNDMYGVDGMERGIRWDGEKAVVDPLGLQKPAVGPTIVASTGSGARYVKDIQIVSPGVGYNNVPFVSFTGGSPSETAKAKATITNGRVTSVVVTDGGAGYSTTPTVSVDGGIAGGAQLSVGVLGTVYAATITNQGTGYTGAPTILFSTAQGLTSAVAVAAVADGKVDTIRLISGGTGATTSGVTASVLGGGGTGAQLRVSMSYRVASVTAVTGGAGFVSPPVITFTPAADDPDGAGAAAGASLLNGSVSTVSVTAGGQYFQVPTAVIRDTQAKLTATMSSAISGKYRCCIRYLDSTPDSRNGPIPSSISDLVEVETLSGSPSITWSFTHPGIEDRVTAMELWRTTADQSVVLFRVATIQRTDGGFFGSYSDTLSDDDLKDTTRADYGLMPVVLPSGQLNARRFGVPPGNFAVGCVFQDRAWYAVDTAGVRPNALLFSEIDEPESVPEENELVLQENAGDPDAVVGLVPLGAALLICQSRHLYKLQYVSQPVIDASITLAAYRGMLNSRCFAVLGGVAYIADSYGLYAFDGQSEAAVSLPIDNYWRDGLIHFPASSVFFMSADQNSKVIRFFYCRQGESLSTRALCYCAATKAWWEETYPVAVTAGTVGQVSGKQVSLYGMGDGTVTTSSGHVDVQGYPIPYEFRTGNFTITDGDNGSRSVGLLYEPTQNDVNLQLRLHYNNSPTPRANAIVSDRGGFLSAGTQSTLNIGRGRSPLGDANGFARAYLSGHRDERNVGGDRHVAIAMGGTQASSQPVNAVKLYGLTVEGVS